MAQSDKNLPPRESASYMAWDTIGFIDKGFDSSKKPKKSAKKAEESKEA